jgi:hypothetical protein
MSIVPMPEGVVYTPFVFGKSKGNTGRLERIENREIPATSLRLIESSVKTKYNVPSRVEERPTSSYAKSTSIARRTTALHSNTALEQFSAPAAGAVATKPSTQSQQRTNSQLVVVEPVARSKPRLIQQRPIRTSRAQSTRTDAQTVSSNIEQVETGTSKPVHSVQTMSRNVTRTESTGLAILANPPKLATQISQ